MPIYAYRCENCGFAKDVLQKFSDPLLTVCPNCGHDSFRKQVTAAGFQLKGSGWYVTDFRDKPTPAVPPVRSDSTGNASDKPAAGASATEGASPAPVAPTGDGKPAASPAPAPAVASKPADKPSSSS